MSKSAQFAEVSIKVDKNNLKIGDTVNLRVNIKNRSKISIENGLFKLFINKNILSTVDNNFKLCVDDFVTIGDILPGNEIIIDILLKVNSIPKNLMSSISCLLNFHTSTNGELIDLNCNSNDIVINFVKESDVVSEGLFNDSCVIYEIDKKEYLINDIINHSLIIKNNSATIIRNLSIKSKLIQDLEFVKDSLVVNDIYRVGETITDDIKLGELEPNETLSIAYKTKAKNLFGEKEINIELSYEAQGKFLTQSSNYVSLKSIEPILSENNFKKSVSKSTYTVGDIVDFKIEIFNNSDISLTDILVKDELSESLNLIEESITVDHHKVNIDITKSGILIKKLDSNQKCIITYKARAISTAKFEYSKAILQYSQNKEMSKYTLYSNSIELNIIEGQLVDGNFKKELSSYSSQIGDIITTRLTIQNIYYLNLDSIKIYEPTNNALEFVEGSLIINNTPHLDQNIFNGVVLNKEQIDMETVLTYNVRVLDFPKPNPIDDRAVLTYTFMDKENIDPKILYSTKVKLYINNPKIEVVDKNAFYEDNEIYKYCHYKDYILYNLILENKGNVGIENIALSFNFPKDLDIDFNSIMVNNAPYKNIEQYKIDLPNMNISQKNYVQFYVKHNFIEKYNLNSFINLNYTFKDLKTKESFKDNFQIKEEVRIINPNLEIVKFISDRDIEVDKEFTKNINIRNTGNTLLEDINVNLNENDLLKNSEKTIFINGKQYSEIDDIKIDYLNIEETVNIAIRYNIGDIQALESLIPESRVSAKYQIFKGDSPLVIKRTSNKIKLNIKNYSIEIKPKNNMKSIVLNKTYNYIFDITNTGNVDCDSFKLELNLPDYIEYEKDSLTINNKKLNIKKISSPIDIEPLKYNESLTAAFNFRVKKIPYKNHAKISAVADVTYNIDDENINKFFQSEEIILKVENIDIDIIKTSSVEYLQSGEVVKVQTIINNIGTIDIKDIVLRDINDDSLVFVEDSGYIDGVNIENLDPLEGIHLDVLKSGENILLSYEYEYLPKVYLNKVSHFSEVKYSYQFENEKPIYEKVKSEYITIETGLSTFKQFKREQENILSDFEPNILEILHVFSDARVDEYHEISSIRNRSIENSNSTGKKVIIKGVVMDRIEYMTDSENGSLYLLERTEPFSIFINVPISCDCDELFFKAKCDDTFYKIINPREIFISSLISIEGLL